MRGALERNLCAIFAFCVLHILSDKKRFVRKMIEKFLLKAAQSCEMKHSMPMGRAVWEAQACAREDSPEPESHLALRLARCLSQIWAFGVCPLREYAL